jgi:hypothetical protein
VSVWQRQPGAPNEANLGTLALGLGTLALSIHCAGFGAAVGPVGDVVGGRGAGASVCERAVA